MADDETDRLPRRLAILPALNEQLTIASVIGEVQRYDPQFDILVVDDGSTDRTVEIARAAGVRVLRLPYNLGIGGAIQTGFLYARRHDYDITVQVDADGQHVPSEISKLLGAIADGSADVVIGSRFVDGGNGELSPPRRIATRFFSWLVSTVIRQQIRDTSSSFRAMNKRAIAFCADDFPQGFLETIESTVILSRHGLRIMEVPVRMRPRAAGRSNLGVVTSLAYSAKVIVAVFVGMFRRVELREDRP